MTAPLNVYLVFYGQWDPQTGMQIVRNFIKSMSNTSISAPSVASWWAITTSYHDGNGNFVSPQVRFFKLLVPPTRPCAALPSVLYRCIMISRTEFQA